MTSGSYQLEPVKKDLLAGMTVTIDPVSAAILDRVIKLLRKSDGSDERFLSETELCRLLRVSRETVRTWRTRKVDPLPFMRPPSGRGTRYDLVKVEGWLRKQAELGRRR